jgi:hypothetical protein
VLDYTRSLACFCLNLPTLGHLLWFAYFVPDYTWLLARAYSVTPVVLDYAWLITCRLVYFTCSVLDLHLVTYLIALGRLLTLYLITLGSLLAGLCTLLTLYLIPLGRLLACLHLLYSITLDPLPAGLCTLLALYLIAYTYCT